MGIVTDMFREGGFTGYVDRGLLHTVGAESIGLNQGGGVTSNFFGKTATSTPNNLGVKLSKGASGVLPVALSTAMFGMSALTLGVGYMDNGMQGALDYGVIDLAVNSALVKHGYKWAKDPGGKGAMIRSSGGLMSGGRMASRYFAGSLVAGAASSALGGGVIGGAAAFAAAHVGVKHSWKVAAAAGGYYAAKATGNAVMGVLKKGYQYRQRQKSINTSGSMAAFNTSGAHTMRQRAVEAIHKSHLNARSALGNEAQFMHMPGRNYGSRYR